MLAPVPPKRSDGGSSFSALGGYLTSTVDADTGEILQRGEVMLSDNLLSSETAAAEMQAVAAQNSRCKDPVMHVVLSWQEGEKPSAEQWQGAVKHALSSLNDRDGRGISDHQYMAVAHADTDHFHVHIMVNRVHPETYKANAPEWLHKSLDKACREIEAVQGWAESNGLYKWDKQQGKAVPTDQKEREQRKEALQQEQLDKGMAGTGKAAKMERYGNAESLETYCKGEPSKDLAKTMQRDGVTWEDVHSTLAKHGLEIHKGAKGGYTVSSEGADGERIYVKASSAFRKHFAGKAQREATESKLGQWQEAKEYIRHVVEKKQTYNQHKEPKRNPQEREQRREERADLRRQLWQEYRAYKADYYAGKRIRSNDDKAAAAERFRSITEQAKDERKRIRAANMAPEAKKAMLSITTARAVQERDKLRQELSIKRQQDKPQDFRTWATARAEQGHPAAISQLRSWAYQEGRDRRNQERRNSEIDRLSSARPTDNEWYPTADPRKQVKESAALRMSWEVDRKTGDVSYKIDGKKAFTDHGERITFGDGKNIDAIEAGLKMAAQKFGGTVQVDGSTEFKKRALQVAIERGINIKFANEDLAKLHQEHQAKIKQEREERTQNRQRGYER